MCYMNRLHPVFRGNFAEPLRFGHCLEICGMAQEGAIRFSISIGTDYLTKANNAEIDLHMIVNLQSDQITFSKYINNEWSNEEFRNYETIELFREFKIYMVMADGKFHISINGHEVTSFPYGLRLSLLKCVEISGDLEYIRQMDHRKYFPCTWPPIQVLEDRLHFSGDVPMAFEPGHVMVISSQLSGNDNGRFIIHLRDVYDMDRQEFHMSIRFDTQRVIRTSKTIRDEEHYDFDVEDTDGDFPFEYFQKPFKLAFALLENEIKIAKDGLFFCHFPFRTPSVLPFIGGLKIFGIDGVQVKVHELEHIKMDPPCGGFEYHCKL
ncbi:32 kDa beta-galactoside-binding lectin-like [Haematobia irritans]|uniref:32 kDa beta-galactoside-binding lectin-like n=1 Tax=Haematobia irritans TaxID=7368 RepID=UPI003F4F79C4